MFNYIKEIESFIYKNSVPTLQKLDKTFFIIGKYLYIMINGAVIYILAIGLFSTMIILMLNEEYSNILNIIIPIIISEIISNIPSIISKKFHFRNFEQFCSRLSFLFSCTYIFLLAFSVQLNINTTISVDEANELIQWFLVFLTMLIGLIFFEKYFYNNSILQEEEDDKE